MSWLARFGGAARPARVGSVSEDDAERLAAIHAEAFARPWSPDEFEQFLNDRSVRTDGLFVGRSRQPVGFALSRVTLDEAEILSVALARAARGRGHSRVLLAHHLQTLAHAGVATVHLEVEDGNARALSLYRGLGFVQCGVRPGYYARPDGTRSAALSMSRALAGDARSSRG